VLAQAISQAWPDPGPRPVCVLGVLVDKDASGIVRELLPAVAGFVVTSPTTPRARGVAELAALVEGAGGTVLATAAGVSQAVSRADLCTEGVGVVVTGSLYTAGEARHAFRAPHGAKDA